MFLFNTGAFPGAACIIEVQSINTTNLRIIYFVIINKLNTIKKHYGYILLKNNFTHLLILFILLIYYIFYIFISWNNTSLIYWHIESTYCINPDIRPEIIQPYTYYRQATQLHNINIYRHNGNSVPRSFETTAVKPQNCT